MNINEIINKKKNDEKLSYEEIEYAVNGYVSGNINNKDMTEFIMLIYNKGLSYEETSFLTDVMVKSGNIIDLSSLKGKCVDKHSSGGIGDKVTLIVSPIVASLGVIVPKMSGRGLGITGGTVDKLESIPGYKISLDKKTFVKQLNEIGICVISQSEKIAVADKKIYALRNEIGAVDSIPLIASSIMSKKIASGSDNIIIDLKVGKGAFMKNQKDACMLAKTMIEIGKYYNKKVMCTLSDMSSPLGYNIGNALEVKEAIDFFEGKYEKRLYALVVYISAQMVSIAKGIAFKTAKKQVLDSLNMGQAKCKFYEWIKYQKGNINKLKIKAKVLEVKSDKTGYVHNINAETIGKLVFDLGAGRIKKSSKIDYSVGVILKKQLGDKVTKGDVLAEIYYNKEIKDMDKVLKSAYSINKNKKRVNNIIIKTIK